MRKGAQIGWVPKDLVPTIGGLQVTACKVRRVGTDEEGNWTQLNVELFYVSNEAVKVDKVGALPKGDRAAAAMELEMLTEAGIVPEGVPKRRRRRST